MSSTRCQCSGYVTRFDDFVSVEVSNREMFEKLPGKVTHNDRLYRKLSNQKWNGLRVSFYHIYPDGDAVP